MSSVITETGLRLLDGEKGDWDAAIATIAELEPDEIYEARDVFGELLGDFESDEEMMDAARRILREDIIRMKELTADPASAGVVSAAGRTEPGAEANGDGAWIVRGLSDPFSDDEMRDPLATVNRLALVGLLPDAGYV